MAHSPGSAEVAQNLQEAAHGEGETLGTGEVRQEEHHAPSALGLDPTAWVALAMAIFIGILLWKRVPALITSGLDKRIAAIREQLDEAARLRSEAQALRDEYAAKAAQAETDAANMIERARHEAEGIRAQAEADAAARVERRTRMAEDKIAAAERTALDEVRVRAVSAAAAAAAALIQGQHGAEADKALVDSTIAGLGRAH